MGFRFGLPPELLNARSFKLTEPPSACSLPSSAAAATSARGAGSGAFMVQLPGGATGGDWPLTVATALKLHASVASNTVAVTALRRDATESLSATLSPSLFSCRAHNSSWRGQLVFHFVICAGVPQQKSVAAIETAMETAMELVNGSRHVGAA